MFWGFFGALGLRCCVWTFSSCGEQLERLLFLAGVQSSHCSGFSSSEAQALVVALGSRAQAQWMCTGLVVLQHVESSWTRA